MADTNTTNQPLYYPQDFNLDEVTVITSDGKSNNLKYMVVELSVFEDIFSSVITGYVILRDGVGLIESLSLDGNEYIKLDYSKYASTPAQDKPYRIYKIGNRKPVGNLDSEFFTLYFCSEALLISEQSRVKRAFPSTPIATANTDTSGIINSILNKELGISSQYINIIEPTYGTYDFIVPRMKPLEAISWLSTYARPAAYNFGADMLFFETRNGYNFRSLQSMFSSNIYKTYMYQVKNLPNETLDNSLNSVLDFEYVKSLDVLNDTNVGAYANKVITIDPLTRTTRTTTFSYGDYLTNKNRYPTQTTLNKYKVIDEGTNRLGVQQDQAFEGVVKMLFGNSNQTRVPLINNNPGSVGKDIFAETFVPLRTAQLNLANYHVLKMAIPGDSQIYAGMTIQFNVYSLLNPGTGTRQLDLFYSGKYLVSSVRHVIQTQGVYQTFLEIIKDSGTNPFVQESASYSKTYGGGG
jgi:hypothetical protein